MKNKNSFIRAFWRRIEMYKNDFEKELPEEIPVQFSSAFETASILLRGEPYLVNRGDGVDGHYCICRIHKDGYREAWDDKKKKWCSAGTVFNLGKVPSN